MKPARVEVDTTITAALWARAQTAPELLPVRAVHRVAPAHKAARLLIREAVPKTLGPQKTPRLLSNNVKQASAPAVQTPSSICGGRLAAAFPFSKTCRYALNTYKQVRFRFPRDRLLAAPM